MELEDISFGEALYADGTVENRYVEYRFSSFEK